MHDESAFIGPPPSSGLRQDVVVARRYRLLRKLDEGGMGTVWVAYHLTLGCEVALKFIHPSNVGYPDAFDRFASEARAAALLAAETDYVVRIFDFGVDDGVPYLAMELLSGEHLGARIARRGRLTPFEIVPIAAQIARALRKAHARNIVHRDLKPENIFIVQRDEEERLKILDFGIAKLLGPSGAPQLTQPMGTLQYIAPEVLTSRRIDCRTDLWSFAVVLYRAAVGEFPFDAVAPGELVLKICNDPIPCPSQRVPSLGTEIDAFFARALCRDPDGRFQSADDLARAFADAARVSWRPPPSAHSPFDATIPGAPNLPSEASGSDQLPTLRSPSAFSGGDAAREPA
ncbi:Putative serine/threonine-protein kinase pknH [Minicystis rosea]|nr:Putative serine/threonine-protein kinase pknH [Minicystis rosea]